MEVGEAVIVEEHDDGDPKEAADRRHVAIMPSAPAAGTQTKHSAPALRLTTVSSMGSDSEKAPSVKVMEEAMRAADRGLSVVLVAADGRTCVLTPDPDFVP
jgi:hypothetical protein